MKHEPIHWCNIEVIFVLLPPSLSVSCIKLHKAVVTCLLAIVNVGHIKLLKIRVFA